MAEIENKKIVWKGKYLQIVRIWFRDKQGNLDVWEAIERIGTQKIAVIVAITKNNELLLVQQFRPPVAKDVIEFPAGLRDQSNETLKQVALRELEEETGYRAKKIKELFSGPVSPGLSSEVLFVFFAENLKFGGKKNGKEEKRIIVHRVPLKKVEKWLKAQRRKGILVDVKVIPLISCIKEIKKKKQKRK